MYIDAEGDRLELGQLKPGNRFVSTLDGLAFFEMGDGLAVVEGIRDGLYHVRHNPQRSRLVRLGDRNRNTVNLHYDDPCRGYVNHNPMHVFEDKRYRYDAEQRLLISDPDMILLADVV